MARKKIPTNLALDPEILAKVEKWMEKQELPVTKTWVLETALREFLASRSND